MFGPEGSSSSSWRCPIVLLFSVPILVPYIAPNGLSGPGRLMLQFQLYWTPWGPLPAPNSKTEFQQHFCCLCMGMALGWGTMKDEKTRKASIKGQRNGT